MAPLSLSPRYLEKNHHLLFKNRQQFHCADNNRTIVTFTLCRRIRGISGLAVCFRRILVRFIVPRRWYWRPVIFQQLFILLFPDIHEGMHTVVAVGIVYDWRRIGNRLKRLVIFLLVARVLSHVTLR